MRINYNLSSCLKNKNDQLNFFTTIILGTIIFLLGTGPSFLAHSAVSSMNDEFYIFGGYNGLSSDKLYHQNTSSNWCAMFSTNVSCNKVSNCVWCVDIASSRAGCYVSNTHSHLSCSPTSNVCQNARYARSEASVWTLSTGACIANTVPGDCSSCMQGILLQGD